MQTLMAVRVLRREARAVGSGPEALDAVTQVEVLDSAACSFGGDDVRWAPQSTQDTSRVPRCGGSGTWRSGRLVGRGGAGVWRHLESGLCERKAGVEACGGERL